MKKKQLFMTVCGLVCTLLSQAQPLLKTHVETGDLEGVLEGNDLACYYAIPFAAPPVGDLRWRAPQPAQPWQGVLKAKECAKWPPQPERGDVSYDMMSEDCLYLSVVTPATSVTDALPVMVYIHGGGFCTEHYGGTLWQSLARHGVITVSIEYRAGALGFMAHPELAKEDPEGHTGNYGMLDQIFALKWIQRNIRNFGGDPSKVTIFGESAGAMSCHLLCASPLAKGLFRACISQSGAFMSPMSLVTQEQASLIGAMYQQRLGKSSIAEMRQVDTKTLTGTGNEFPASTPVIDRYVMTNDVYRLYEQGEYSDVPVLIMVNSDEGAAMIDTTAAKFFDQQLTQLPPAWVDTVKVCYPATTDEERLFAFRDFIRDINFSWPAYAWATLQKQTGKSPVYMAYLAQQSERTVYAHGNRRGAAHADDCMYLGGAFDAEADKYPEEKRVSDLMQQYWVNFAKTGNPNGQNNDALPLWPEFEDQKPTVMQFKDGGSSLITVPHRHNIDVIGRFYDSIRSKVTYSN